MVAARFWKPPILGLAPLRLRKKIPKMASPGG
jgi:hypothetical protein